MILSKQIVAVILGFFLLVSQIETRAQDVKGVSTNSKIESKNSSNSIIHISPLLREESFYEDIQKKFRYLKTELKKKPVKESSVGDTTSFFIRNVLLLDTWNSISAKCIYKSDQVVLWAGIDDYNFYGDSLSFSDIVDSLSYRIEKSSGSSSVDPLKGILNLNKEYFGSMPDIDGDGVLDILLLDIEDSFSETGGFVAGFFDPVDLIEHEFSNRRDLLYIDIYPTLFYKGEENIQRVASTIAHELQHLIHANYETSERQFTFINEGLSEYAEVLNGFSPRNPTPYYQQPNRALFSWSYDDPIPDYVRGSLFFLYLFEQLGADKAKHLVQDRTDIGFKSVSDFIKQHSDRTFEELFIDWGLSLLGVTEGNTGFDHAELKQISPSSAVVKAAYPSVVNYASTPLSHAFFYGALTEKIELISNIDIEAFAQAEYPSGASGPLQAGGAHFYAGEEDHGSLWMLLSNTEPQLTEPDTASELRSVLFNGNKSGYAEELVYDDGIPDTFTGNASYVQLSDRDAVIAVLFSTDEEYWLSEIGIKTIFSSELSGSGVPAQSTRDIELQIYSVKDGVPGQPLTPAFTHAFTRPFGNLKFESISLTSFYKELSSLTDSIAVLIRNDPDDENYVAVGMDYSGNNYSLKRNRDGSWVSFKEVAVGNVNLSGWNPMVRAIAITSKFEKEALTPKIQLTDSELMVTFNAPEEIDTMFSRSVALIPSGQVFDGNPDYSNSGFGETRYRFPIQVGGEYTIVSSLQGISGTQYESRDQWSVPENADFRIGNNYPNPFNPATTIPFLLLEDGQVGVTVYDILGRKVLSVPEQFYAAGSQTIQLDFAGLASGMYILKLDVTRSDNGRNRGAITRIRKITFVK